MGGFKPADRIRCLIDMKEQRVLSARSHKVTICIYPSSRRNDSDEVVHDEMASVVQMRLPFIPQLGEGIEMEFVDPKLKYNQWWVHDIHHINTPACQEVFVFVNIEGNYYYKWRDLKQETLQPTFGTKKCPRRSRNGRRTRAIVLYINNRAAPGLTRKMRLQSLI